MGLFALAGAGIPDAEGLFPRALAAVDRAGMPGCGDPPPDVLLPGVYVTGAPMGDAPWAGIVCTHWSHVTGAPAAPCRFCGIRWA